MKLKRSGAPGLAPSPDQLVLGELAVNTADGKLFLKRSDGTVVEVGNAPGTVPFDVMGTCLRAPDGPVLFRIVLVRPVTFPAGLIGSAAVAERPFREPLALDLRRNGTGFGSIIFARRAATATLVSWSDIAFAGGDLLTVTALTARDAERADGIAFTLAGVR